MHICYKLINTDFLRALELRAEGFGYATEVISKLLRRGEPIFKVPIHYHGRTMAAGKKIGWWDGVACLIDLVRYRFSKLPW